MESDKIELAKELEKKAAAKGVKFILPTDVILANKFAADADTKVPPLAALSFHWQSAALLSPTALPPCTFPFLVAAAAPLTPAACTGCRC